MHAQELVMSGFIGIVESTPATHIVNKNRPELCVTVKDVFQQCTEALAVLNNHATLTGVFVCLDDIEATALGVFLNSDSLIDNRILLILRRHPQVSRSGIGEVAAMGSPCRLACLNLTPWQDF
jgi:hypothetical protein